MSIIATIEDTLIATINSTLRNADGDSLVRTIDYAPPDWDEDFLKRVMRALPGVFLIFEGGLRDPQFESTTILNTRWTVVAISNAARDPKARARGEVGAIGCYDMLEMLAPVLNQMQVTIQNEVVGTLSLTDWINDEALSLDKQSLMVQSLAFELPVEIPRVLNPSDLVPFKTFHDTFDIDQQPGAPVTEDTVELEQ